MNNKYEKANLEEFVKKSKSIADVCRFIGIGTKGNNFKTVKKYINLYQIDISHFETKEEQIKKLHLQIKIPLENILVENSTYTNNFYLKKRLLTEGIKKNICEICGLKNIWNGLELNMQLDHKNGINNDNRLDNLRFLCPNCHSQTETFCGKNKSKKFKKTIEKNENGGKTLKQLEAYRKKRIVENRPSKEELVILIMNNGFVKTGKQFNVSDNCIRKWCKDYNLSTKIKDYKDV